MRIDLLPGGNFRNFPDHLSAIVDEMIGRQFVRFCPTDAWQPDVNLYETADSFIVCVDLAGLSAEEINVDVQGQNLVVRGRRQPPVPAQRSAHDIHVHLMEINSGQFCREVEIPQSVRSQEIEAGYRDGLLWVTLPKSA